MKFLDFHQNVGSVSNNFDGAEQQPVHTEDITGASAVASNGDQFQPQTQQPQEQKI